MLLKAIYELSLVSNLRSKMSIWHVQAYIIGVQTALLSLNIEDVKGNLAYEGFLREIMKGQVDTDKEFQSIWLRSKSPVDSVSSLLSELDVFMQRNPLLPSIQIEETNSRLIDLRTSLKTMKGKPQLFFAEPHITYLKAWFEGVQYVANALRVKVIPDLDSLENDLKSRFQIASNCPWDMLLTGICGGNGIRAYSRFFDEWKK